jgi:hypothetical protein
MERIESIGSIDTIYRNDSADIVEYNPHPNPDAVFNPIFNQELNSNNDHIQLTHILLHEDKNKNKIPTWYYIVAAFITGFSIALVIVIIYNYSNT